MPKITGCFYSITDFYVRVRLGRRVVFAFDIGPDFAVIRTILITVWGRTKVFYVKGKFAR